MMATTAEATTLTAAALARRVVRYADLVPCYNAFIDTRTPGSEAKENFTIIGPGVSENPAQFVHIAEPHGFNIGAARQPPHCVNSQHSHDSAEVFVVMTGHWRFDLGEDGTDAQVELAPGDLISLPTKTFRGFTNIGSETGFLFAVLGNDDPGRVTWAPQVFAMARDYGLVLLDSGRLIDTAAGESLAADMVPMPPTSAAAAAAMRRLVPIEAEALVVRASAAPGMTALIGPDAPIGWPHGFSVSRLVLAAGSSHALGGQTAARVLWVQVGGVTCRCAGADLLLCAGDTFTVPQGEAVVIHASADATLFIVTGDAAA
jgi:mannose-6-phosphate isomerase-like protein (cupin superfamily)